MLLKDCLRPLTVICLPVVLLPLMMCAAGAPQVTVTTSSEFYMQFRNAPTIEARADLVKRYPDISRKTFYDHIVLMATDFSYKDLSPVEYDKAIQMGRLLANQYEQVYGDSQLKDTYERMMWDLDQ